jgi:hypothetical protein
MRWTSAMIRACALAAVAQTCPVGSPVAAMQPGSSACALSAHADAARAASVRLHFLGGASAAPASMGIGVGGVVERDAGLGAPSVCICRVVCRRGSARALVARRPAVALGHGGA